MSPGYECVAASGVQWVDVTAGVVKCPVPEVFGELKSHFPLSQDHLFAVPHIHLTAKVKHQHLQQTQHSDKNSETESGVNLTPLLNVQLFYFYCHTSPICTTCYTIWSVL